MQAHDTLAEGLEEHFVPLCLKDIELQAQSVLPHLNAKKGILESPDHADLRCSCCSGEFLFSFVCLIKRKGQPLILQSELVPLSSATMKGNKHLQALYISDMLASVLQQRDSHMAAQI